VATPRRSTKADSSAPSEVVSDPPPPPAPTELPGNVTAAAVLLLIFGTLAGLGTAFMVFILLTFAAIPVSPMMWDPSLSAPDGCYGVMLPDGSNSCDWGAHVYPGWSSGTAYWPMGLLSVALMAIAGVAVTGGHIAAGVAILQRQNWGRILGMVVSGASLVLLILLVGSMLVVAASPMPGFENARYAHGNIGRMMTGSILFSALVAVALGAAYGFVLWVLARRGDVFR
jgi:hypothetical protein